MLTIRLEIWWPHSNCTQATQTHIRHGQLKVWMVNLCLKLFVFFSQWLRKARWPSADLFIQIQLKLPKHSLTSLSFQKQIKRRWKKEQCLRLLYAKALPCLGRYKLDAVEILILNCLHKCFMQIDPCRFIYIFIPEFIHKE